LYINTDVIAKERGIGAYDAALEATRQRAEAMQNEQSFVMETVLSTHEKIDFMRAAKLKGYHVHLEYLFNLGVRSVLIKLDVYWGTSKKDVPSSSVKKEAEFRTLFYRTGIIY
jgi:predicted ABC-type ATPase